MKRIYYNFMQSQVSRSARLVLMLLILMTFISFSNTTSSVYGQTTPEVCRETQKVLEQYYREYEETKLILRLSKDLNKNLRLLGELDKAVRGGVIIGGLQDELYLGRYLSRELGTMGSSPKERLDYQSRLYTFLKKYLSEAAEVEDNQELQDKIDRIDNQIELRLKRTNDLNCYEVLKRKPPTTEEPSALNVSATWNFECCGGAYKGKLNLIQNGDNISGYFGETTNGTTGEISGRINGSSLTFTRRWNGQQQVYNLTVSADGKMLTGNFTGDRNTSVGTDVKATRP